ncbi:MAG: hypothetical protein AB2417_10900 [Clostridiaceae bacterium]
MKKFIYNIIVICLVAFILQFTWEYIQCGIFYTMEDLTGHTRLMASATLGDVNMSIVLYLLLAYVNRDIDWINSKWNRHDFVIMILYALFLSFYFEISALYRGRWGYNLSKMPLFPTTPIGLIPVLQLVILLPLVFYISKLIIRKVR